MNRTSIKVAGQSGSGLLSVGEIIMKALKRKGYYFNADREYPSLIKGGHGNYQIDFDVKPIRALSETIDLILAVDRIGLKDYIDRVKEGGILIHGDERHKLIFPSIEKRAKARNVQLVYLPARKIAESLGGNALMANMVLLGLAWRVLNLSYDVLEEEVKIRFASKPKLLEIDLKCLKAGFEAEGIDHIPEFDMPEPKKKKEETMVINGNDAIALGGIHGGVRAYYAYPMSPSSSILTYFANTAHKTGIAVKQGEDEITVAQMVVGSMHMGTRALCATSGGGFDLMTETVSLAGIIECPFVCVICQRPGPGTGLPTWTCQGDLNLAIGSAHGEFPRVVIGCSDQKSCFELTQHALNMAEKYQMIVLVLTEKVICETKTTIPPFEQKKIPIERGIVTDAKRLKRLQNTDRYKITKSGVSKRWLPGASEAFYYANSDEHLEDGSLTEDARPSKAMMEKRMRKLETVKTEAIPEPKIYGVKKDADVSVIGWGSTKSIMLDAIDESAELGIKVNYLHYDYLWPVQEKAAQKFFAENKKVCLLEGNYMGQFGNILEAETRCIFYERFLKYDGRPFFLEEVIRFLQKVKKE